MHHCMMCAAYATPSQPRFHAHLSLSIALIQISCSPKVACQKFSSCDMSGIHWTALCISVETEVQRRQSGASCFEAQHCADSSTKENAGCRTTVVEHSAAEVLQSREICKSLTIRAGLRKKKEVAQSQARCNGFSRYPQPTKHARDEACHSPQLVWKKTSLDLSPHSDGVEPSSFTAAGRRLPVHHNSSSSAACPGGHQATPKKHLSSKPAAMEKVHDLVHELQK